MRDSPVHQVTLKAFRIARFPVTVKEFAGFQEDGGYQGKRYWSAGGFGVRLARRLGEATEEPTTAGGGCELV